MIRALNLTKNIYHATSRHLPLPVLTFAPKTLINTNRLIYNFSSQGDRLPKNKQQAWMMQEQKQLKQNPLESGDEDSYSTFNKKAGIIFIAMAAGLIYMVIWAEKRSEDNLALFGDQDISGLREVKEEESLIGGDWTLVDTQGKPFSSNMLTGYYYLVYFGYTNSPDACPSALYYLSTVYRVIRNIPEGAYLKLKVIFISIDPERDTPQNVKSFLSHFNKNIIGVTASGPNDIELAECLKKFRIHGKKVYNEHSQNKNKYQMDFNTRVFLMDTQNKYVWHVDPQLTEQQAAKVIVTKIVEKEHFKEKKMQGAGL